MKITKKMFIHVNLHLINNGDEKYTMPPFDASDGDTYALIGEQEVEIEIPDVDCRLVAAAQYDKAISIVNEKAADQVALLKQKKSELLAIGSEVAA